MLMAKIETGSEVSIRFSLFLADIDRLVDTTGADGKFDFVVGEGSIIPGLEKHLIGLEPGDTGRFEIPCEEAYGMVVEDSDLVQHFTQDDFPKSMELEPGLVIGFQSPTATKRRARLPRSTTILLPSIFPTHWPATT